MLDSSEPIDALAKALVKAQSQFEAVSKTAENPFFHSKYADLATVVRTAAPILAANGLAVIQTLGYTLDEDTLTTRLIHESGQWIEDMARLHLTKKDSQGLGSATTYARRYAYMAILGLVADEDDDGNAARADEKPKKTTIRRAAPVVESAPSKGPNLGYLYSLLSDMDDDKRHIWATEVLGREITTFNDLTQKDVNKLAKARVSSTPQADDDPQRPF